MKIGLPYLLTGLLLASISTANATVIVDTGPGAGSNTGGWSLYSGQHLAAKFTTTQTFTVTDVEGWIGGGSLSGNTATLAIYDDTGAVPGTELFSAGFTANRADNWYGASGLSWLLNAGSYWVAFEVRPGDTFDGYMENPASAPLAAEAFTQNGTWIQNWGLDIGVRISSNPSQGVPEPTTVALIGLGLVGIGMRRKRRALKA